MGVHGTEKGQEQFLNEYLWFLRLMIYHIGVAYVMPGICYARYAAKYAKFTTFACCPHLVNNKKETVQINFTSINFEASLGKVYKMLKEILEGSWVMVMFSPRL